MPLTFGLVTSLVGVKEFSPASTPLVAATAGEADTGDWYHDDEQNAHTQGNDVAYRRGGGLRTERNDTYCSVSER